MKKTFIYSAIVLLAAAAACNKTESAISGDGQIRFALTSPETRSLVESVTDLQNDQTIKVFDYLDGTNYFDADETVSYSGGAWNYDSGKGYTWKAGTHKFFAYTKDDACTFANNVLTVSKTLTTAEENQVDIVYSNIVSKTAEQAKADNYSAVVLNMDHLFSAVAISLKNATSAPVTVKSVTTNIPNAGSATISYAGDVPVVTPGEEVTQDGAYIVGTALSNEEVAADGLVDVLGQAAATADKYWLVWPQTLDKGDVKVTVSYTMNSKDYEAEVILPATPEGGWAAGNKYLYTLNIYPTEVQLIFKVQPWDQQTQTINTATGSINMSNVTWMNSVVKVNGEEKNTVVNDEYSVYMHNKTNLQVLVDDEWVAYTAHDYYPAQGFFTVNYPSSGLYKIGLIPAYKMTTVEEDAYEIYIYEDGAFRAQKPGGETITNDTVYFQVRAAEGQDGAQHKAQVDIWFKATGSDEWVSAYSEVRATYTLIIPAVSTGTGD